MPEINLKEMKRLVDEGYISMREHPTAPLLIWNYTPKAQYERMWTEETLSCRGLITDLDGNVKARPFRKFFNLEEHNDKLPLEPFEVYEKMDGSLGIMYWVDDKPYIATRGSFISEQAIKANEMLSNYQIDGIDQKYTYLFEIIYPENRIVVDYGDREELVLLAVIETKTGEEVSIAAFEYFKDFPVAPIHNGVNDINKLRNSEKENSEGFVVRFLNSNLRLKLKYKEYVRLHRLLTQVSTKSIWELLKNKQRFDELLSNVPDEFYGWVRSVAEELEKQYYAIFHEARDWYITNIHTEFKTTDRKSIAEKVKTYKYPHLVFAMMDKKDTWDSIWKMIKPKYEQPFKKDIDA